MTENAFVCPTCALSSPAAVYKSLTSTIVALVSLTIQVIPHRDQPVTLQSPLQASISREVHSPDCTQSFRACALTATPRRKRPQKQWNLETSSTKVQPRQAQSQEPDEKHREMLSHDELLMMNEERNRRRVVEEAWQVFMERFVDDSSVNWQSVRQKLDKRPLRSNKDLDSTLEWLFARTDDPFTRYLTSEQLEAMKGDIDGEMCGVGIIFSAERHGWGRRKRVVIKHVVQNSPAAEAGLQKGDYITAIDMVGIRRLSFDDATTRLLGKEGHKVLITFKRDNSPHGVELSVLLKRRRFEVPTVSAERVYVPSVGEVGYIQVREFAANTATQTRAAVRRMIGHHGVALILLDMRGNSGGLVDKAVEVAKVFLERDQIVVRFVGRNGQETTERCRWGFFGRRHTRATKEPMMVLVDGETASASELVAAALRDNCRAVVVGRATFGKGSVQAIVPLSNGGGAAVTVARYKTPRNDGIVMGKGLHPDLLRNDVGDDVYSVVKTLFGRAANKRYKWVEGRLNKCVSRRCKGDKESRSAVKLFPGEKTWR